MRSESENLVNGATAKDAGSDRARYGAQSFQISGASASSEWGADQHAP